MRITGRELRKMIREAFRDPRSRFQMMQDLGDPPGPPRPKLIPPDPDEYVPGIVDLGSMMRKKQMVLSQTIGQFLRSNPMFRDMPEAQRLLAMEQFNKQFDDDIAAVKSMVDVELMDPYEIKRIEKGAEGSALLTSQTLKDLDLLPDDLQKLAVIEIFMTREELESVLKVLQDMGRGEGLAYYLQEFDSAAYNMMGLIRSIADIIDARQLAPNVRMALMMVEDGSWWGIKG